MKIAISTGNYDIVNSIVRIAKNVNIEISISRLKEHIFTDIGSLDMDGYILSSDTPYTQEAVDTIKENTPHIPIVILGMGKVSSIKGADFFMPWHRDFDLNDFTSSLISNICIFNEKFEKLQKLTAKVFTKVSFKGYDIDPMVRTLSYNGEKLQKLAPKQCKLLEMLGDNFGHVITKDVILETIWKEDNYFVNRSLDVHVTHIRNILKKYNMPMELVNINRLGLMLSAKL